MRPVPILVAAALFVSAWPAAAPVTGRLLSGASGAARAEAPPARPTPEEAVRRLFGPAPVEADWFAPAFLAQVPAAQIGVLTGQLVADFGPLGALRLTEGTGVAAFARAEIPVTVALDGEGRIAGLFFGAPQAGAEDPAALAARIAAAAEGEAAVLALVDGVEVAAIAADAPMAVGSAFKLLVLAAYEAAVAEGRIARDGVARLEAGDRSLPTGALQTLAPGTPVTHETLAGLMIQHSDNTATDALMRLLGREAAEAFSPRNRPLPATAELFKLSIGARAAARAAFAAGDEAERRAILADLAAAPLPDPRELTAAPTWREVEWRMTAREICALLADLRDAPALNGAPNPLVATEGWGWIGYKGGSEFGVLNLSAAGIDPRGRLVCAVMTANGDALQPEGRLATLFAALFRGLGAAEG